MNNSVKIDEYILSHTTRESELLSELTRQTHLKMLYPRQLSGQVQGKLLELISLMIRPKAILEIGTYTGYSAICLSKGLVENAVVDTIEINDEIAEFTQKFLIRANLTDLIHLYIGNALQIIPTLQKDYDLVFMDGDKRQYPQYYSILINKLKSGSFILADNVLWSGKVIEEISENDLYTKGIREFNRMVQEDNRVENVLLPVRDGLMLIRKL